MLSTRGSRIKTIKGRNSLSRRPNSQTKRQLPLWSSLTMKFLLALFALIFIRVVFFSRIATFTEIDSELKEFHYKKRYEFVPSSEGRSWPVGSMRATATEKGTSQMNIIDDKMSESDYRNQFVPPSEIKSSPVVSLGTTTTNKRTERIYSKNAKMSKKGAKMSKKEGLSYRKMDAGQEEESDNEERSSEIQNSEREDESDDDERSSQEQNLGDEEDKNSHDEEPSSEAKSSDEGEQSKDKSDEDMYFRDPNKPVADWDYFPSLKQEIRRDASWNQATTFASEISTWGQKECHQFMNNVDTSPPPWRDPSNKACDGYDGVLHIHHFDHGGASGTAFFLFTIAMLAWADQHNYLPWIHIDDNYTKPIWDPIVHTNLSNAKYKTYEMMDGMDIDWARDPNDSRSHMFPGKPFQSHRPGSQTFELKGTGVWEHYFLPPNDFVPGDLSCRNKPIVKMNDDHIVPGLHSNAPWAPRAWRYTEVPNIELEDLTWDEWFKPQRKRGAELTARYIRFNLMMERRAHCSFPNTEFSLGMHIRHGDKFIEREVIEIERFLEFATVFVENGGGSIFIATDSSKVIKNIMQTWPKDVVDHVVHQPSVLGLTSNTTAAFDLGVSAHRTNVEALTDVLALSKSTFFLHGLSAMSEAVLFLNPGLVERSINLEDDVYKNYHPESFVRSIMPLGRKDAKNE